MRRSGRFSSRIPDGTSANASPSTAANWSPPDVVLTDVRMPVMDGIEATRLIGERAPDVRVLVLTMFELDDHVFAALRAGATGFLLKDTRPADLCSAVRVAASGDALLGPDAPPGADVAALAPREREVLTLVASGLSTVEIAERM
ncbi:response regulator [Amycolatopsis sp. VS8301801F10]|uniref:response regulator transcription factor n=1 Tax=Amycolatopsis sp. VS8301801F10 TaxID=2652442 RepID=UPI0038FC912A